jgi:hypothetical protein
LGQKILLFGKRAAKVVKFQFSTEEAVFSSRLCFFVVLGHGVKQAIRVISKPLRPPEIIQVEQM